VNRLIVWRHGNTDWNAGGRVQGQIDVPLNDLGREQAVDAADLLVRLGRPAEAAQAYERALELATNAAERAFLAGRLAGTTR